MADLTMGQRIAERRKLLNLSQEALGEKMGVSRQAISKWEADAAVPEIDKLIAMSKLFSVSIGWLLGTETESDAEEEKSSFSEDQLRMVEEIVKRYHQPPQNNKHVAPIAAAGAMLLLPVGIAVAMYCGNFLSQELGIIRGQLGSLFSYYSSLTTQLDDVTDRLDDLAQGEKLLSEYTLESAAWDDMAGATVRFSAFPKNTVAGEQAWLSVRLNDEEVAKAKCTTDGTVYTAEVDLPAADGYSYYFQVTYEGGGRAQQKLTRVDGTCVDLLRALNGTVSYDMKGWHYSWKAGIFGVNFLVNRIDPPLYREDVDETWTKLDLVVLRNGVEIERKSYLNDLSSGVAYEVYDEDCVSYVLYSDGVDIQYEYSGSDFEDTDKLTLQLEYSFGNNQVSVQPVVDFWMEDGEPKVDEYAMIAEP